MASDDLRAKIAEALCADAHEPPRAVPNAAEPRHRIGACYEHIRGADAVLAVVQPELDDLARIRQTLEAANDAVTEAAIAERDEARAAVARASSLLDELEDDSDGGGMGIDLLRAALRTPDGGSDD